ncbi:hypothetical protein BDF20DRAFT_839271 [Mycotypha africana]|uniref:uncharacterized protein n=1 Tax=Mycotypha africana TaxID=64632 RepID=UPI002301F345|nr:uncharacterized protein BDF20DRAFT_839271 [Mycotypha africana]KAI8969340.1 hypothetical protein BDF20DRAFT_839271 [Mycotypha africana]
MTLLSLKTSFRFFSHTSVVAPKYSQLTKKQAKPCLLQKLPNEVIACIYYHLETPECKAEFARICKSFYQTSVQLRSKAGWIFTRVGPRFAIYYALLSCPEHCTSSFLDILLHFGAVIPYHLLQSVVLEYGKPKQQQYQHQRRRSSQILDDYFHEQIQKLPFEGFVKLLYEGNRRYKGQINIQQLSVQQQAFSCLHHQKGSSTINNCHELERMIHQQWFFPAPHYCTQHYSLRSLTKYRSIFETIFPLFEFDPSARAQLWEAILSLFFDEAFKSNSDTATLTKQHQELFGWIGNLMNKRVMLLSSFKDEHIFCEVFIQFFTKYPVGYCQEKTMKKLLLLLKQYVQTTFSLEMTLEEIVERQLCRPDISQFVSLFLDEERKKLRRH